MITPRSRRDGQGAAHGGAGDAEAGGEGALAGELAGDQPGPDAGLDRVGGLEAGAGGVADRVYLRHRRTMA
jgi:hypothetical protein